MIKRLSFVVAVIAVSLAITSCVSIPMSGPVNRGGAVAQADSGFVQFLPDGPAQGASQEEILRGFIEASSSSNDDYAIARLFLAPTARAKWDPNASVLVDDGSRQISVSDNSALLTTGELAQVSALGEYSNNESAVTVELGYRFTQVDGQWRISTVPQGIVIDSTTFSQVYETHALYFFDPSFTYLVPDVRWFARGNTTSTRIVKTLLAGPAPWLAQADAVRSAFGSELALATSSVPVVDGVAAVNLNDALLAQSAVVKQRIRQQLAASLTTVYGINSVAILVDGALQANIVTNPLDKLSPEPVDSQPLVLTASRFGYLINGAIAPIDNLSARVVEQKPTAIAYDSLSGVVAMRTSAGVVAMPRGADPVVVDERPGLLAPSVDWLGFTWSVPRTDPADVWASAADGTKVGVTTVWPHAGSISALKVSRDGTRVAALINNGDRFELVVAGITRNEENQPVALGPTKILDTFSEPVTDLSWTTSQSVAVVGPSSETSSLVSTYIVGGAMTTSSEVPTGLATTIAGANLTSQLKVLDANGNLFEIRNATLWQKVSDEILVLATIQ